MTTKTKTKTISNKFKTSSLGVDIIKRFEGLRLHAYLCPANIVTIGYGTTSHKGAPIRLGMVWTKEQAEDALLEDLESFENSVNKLAKAPINQQMFDALVSFAYNVGVGSLEKSTLLQKLNEKEYQDAASQFLRWNKVNGQPVRGLTLRRQAECNLFLVGLKELNKK